MEITKGHIYSIMYNKKENGDFETWIVGLEIPTNGTPLELNPFDDLKNN